jgi:hypothetical protein
MSLPRLKLRITRTLGTLHRFNTTNRIKLIVLEDGNANADTGKKLKTV